MKNIFVVLFVIIISQVVLHAASEADLQYVCRILPAPQSVSGDLEMEPQMMRICKPVNPGGSAVLEQSKEFSEDELPGIGPVKNVFQRVMFRNNSR